MQVRTVPAELRMSGIRIHSHAQLSSCGNLGTPETAKLLHSTPACVCVCVRVEAVRNWELGSDVTPWLQNHSTGLQISLLELDMVMDRKGIHSCRTTPTTQSWERT